MNFKKTNDTFKVVLSVGDESGIGPEIILKALCSEAVSYTHLTLPTSDLV